MSMAIFLAVGDGPSGCGRFYFAQPLCTRAHGHGGGNEFIFKQPVRVGDLLSFYSKVVRIGKTSITVLVEVFAECCTDQGRYVKVTEAKLTLCGYRPRRPPTAPAPSVTRVSTCCLSAVVL